MSTEETVSINMYEFPLYSLEHIEAMVELRDAADKGMATLWSAGKEAVELINSISSSKKNRGLLPKIVGSNAFKGLLEPYPDAAGFKWADSVSDFYQSVMKLRRKLDDAANLIEVLNVAKKYSDSISITLTQARTIFFIESKISQSEMEAMNVRGTDLINRYRNLTGYMNSLLAAPK